MTVHQAPAPVEEPVADDSVRLRVIMIAVFAFALLGVGMLVGLTRSKGGSEPNWIELGQPVEMPDVELTDTNGRPYNLRTEQEGRLTLLYFGYLNCPDACPIHMAVLGRTFEQLEPEVRAAHRCRLRHDRSRP